MTGNHSSLPAFAVADVIPHTGTMCLLDRIERCTEDSIITRVDVRAESTFATGAGVPAWIGLEYMAQSIAALAGSRAKVAGQPVRIGFLVGTRQFQSHTQYFPCDSAMHIHARELVLGSNGLGVYACRITPADNDLEVLVQGDVNVFLPADTEQYLQNALARGTPT